MNKLKTLFAALFAFALCAMAQLHAAVPTAYTDAVDDTVADVGSFGTSTYTALAGAAVIFVLGAVLLRMIFKGKSVAK